MTRDVQQTVVPQLLALLRTAREQVEETLTATANSSSNTGNSNANNSEQLAALLTKDGGKYWRPWADVEQQVQQALGVKQPVVQQSASSG